MAGTNYMPEISINSLLMSCGSKKTVISQLKFIIVKEFEVVFLLSVAKWDETASYRQDAKSAKVLLRSLSVLRAFAVKFASALMGNAL